MEILKHSSNTAFNNVKVIVIAVQHTIIYPYILTHVTTYI